MTDDGEAGAVSERYHLISTRHGPRAEMHLDLYGLVPEVPEDFYTSYLTGILAGLKAAGFTVTVTVKSEVERTFVA